MAFKIFWIKKRTIFIFGDMRLKVSILGLATDVDKAEHPLDMKTL